MITAWTQHCKSEEDKAQYVESLKRARWVLDDIQRLVDSNMSSQEASEISPKVYENSNWAYRQAHANGYKQALRDFKQLLTID